MQGIGETRRPSGSSRENQGRGRGLSSLKDLPKTLAYPFADQLEAWKENARARSGTKPKNKNNATRRHRNSASASRGGPVVYGGGGGGKDKKRDPHSNPGKTDNGRSYKRASSAEELLPKARAWNSGSLLVRPGCEAPSAQVPRMTYIYLVGNARAGDGVEVEVVVGADTEKARTALSKSSGVTCARVPAREVYTVRNLSGDGKTAVLFWTSPSGDGGDEVAHEQPQETHEQPQEKTESKGGKEEAENEMPQPLKPLPMATRNALAAPIDGGFASEEGYGME